MAKQAQRVVVKLETGEEILVSWELAQALIATGMATLAGEVVECAVQTGYETR